MKILTFAFDLMFRVFALMWPSGLTGHQVSANVWLLFYTTQLNL